MSGGGWVSGADALALLSAALAAQRPEALAVLSASLAAQRAKALTLLSASLAAQRAESLALLPASLTATVAPTGRQRLGGLLLNVPSMASLPLLPAAAALPEFSTHLAAAELAALHLRCLVPILSPRQILA